MLQTCFFWDVYSKVGLRISSVAIHNQKYWLPIGITLSSIIRAGIFSFIDLKGIKREEERLIRSFATNSWNIQYKDANEIYAIHHTIIVVFSSISFIILEERKIKCRDNWFSFMSDRPTKHYWLMDDAPQFFTKIYDRFIWDPKAMHNRKKPA